MKSTIVSAARAIAEKEKIAKREDAFLKKEVEAQRKSLKQKAVSSLKRELTAVKKAFPKVKIEQLAPNHQYSPPSMSNRYGDRFGQEPIYRVSITMGKWQYLVALVCGMVPSPYDGDPDYGHVPPSWEISYCINGTYLDEKAAHFRIAEFLQGQYAYAIPVK